MAWAFVQQKVEQSTTNVASFTTSAFTVTAGDTLVVASCANKSGPGINLAITDSVGDAFATAVISEVTPSGQRVQWDTTASSAGGSMTATVTMTGDTGFLSIAVHDYSGGTGAVETSNTGQASDHAPSCGALSPPSASDLYVMACTHNGSANETFTAGGGFTRRANLTLTANMPLGTEEFITSGLQIGSATYGGAGAVSWNAAGVTVRAGDVSAPDPNVNLMFMVSGDQP